MAKVRGKLVREAPSPTFGPEMTTVDATGFMDYSNKTGRCVDCGEITNRYLRKTSEPLHKMCEELRTPTATS